MLPLTNVTYVELSEATYIIKTGTTDPLDKAGDFEEVTMEMETL